MDKIQFLQQLLDRIDASSDIETLLRQLNAHARKELGSEGGLPTYDTDHMRMMIKLWLVDIILKVS